MVSTHIIGCIADHDSSRDNSQFHVGMQQVIIHYAKNVQRSSKFFLEMRHRVTLCGSNTLQLPYVRLGYENPLHHFLSTVQLDLRVSLDPPLIL